MRQSRREFLRSGSASIAAAALGGIGGCVSVPDKGPKVVVVGGGFAGATAAKYVRKWSDGKIAVTLVERGSTFVSCPLSNLVLGGSRQIADLTVPYGGLDKWGVRRVSDEAMAIDPAARTVRLSGGTTLPYDRLILAPGIDFMWDAIPALAGREAQEKILHAWKAGAQTIALRRQLEAMPDGGVFVMHIPKAPYRCPPGPYERACQVAFYFSTQKKKSKVIILDANDDVVSKKGLFTAAWNGRYKGYVEYRPNSGLVDVDVATLTAKLDFDNVKAGVLNIIPPQHAGGVARALGMANANGRFCQVDFLSFESTAQRNIHVVGDATQNAQLMPKSGHMANQHAKVCAAAVVALLTGGEVNQTPVIANTCYSYIDDKEVVHVASVHRYDPDKKTMSVVTGSGGLSPAPSVQEAVYADAWARNIWADMLA
ncbi:MAG TPA: NAD(P)/FAD-dependent oxidoreductase [Casimicrobiaceae bacterium]|jgi:NADPH-dependent 2,4-dienoyl-CoA reductase/sulfur reductase-like enzyme|nr:NAD(P)/FAD-dependent oxidoreductase [Casimicrobiaceae bacterium]